MQNIHNKLQSILSFYLLSFKDCSWQIQRVSMSFRLRRISSLEYFYIRLLWKCSPQDSLWSEMDSEEFAITSPITLQSTLVFTGFTAKSCQLIVPHSMTCLAVCLLFSSRYVVYAVSESKVHIHTKKTLKCCRVCTGQNSEDCRIATMF